MVKAAIGKVEKNQYEEKVRDRWEMKGREAGEEPKGLGGSGPCAEGPSLCWQLCPASPREWKQLIRGRGRGSQS